MDGRDSRWDTERVRNWISRMIAILITKNPTNKDLKSNDSFDISVGGSPTTATSRPTYATTTRPYWTRTASGWIHIEDPPLYTPDGQIYTSDEQSGETVEPFTSSEELYDPSTPSSPSASSPTLVSDNTLQKVSEPVPAQEHDLSQPSLVRLYPFHFSTNFSIFSHLTISPKLCTKLIGLTVSQWIFSDSSYRDDRRSRICVVECLGRVVRMLAAMRRMRNQNPSESLLWWKPTMPVRHQNTLINHREVVLEEAIWRKKVAMRRHALSQRREWFAMGVSSFRAICLPSSSLDPTTTWIQN